MKNTKTHLATGLTLALLMTLGLAATADAASGRLHVRSTNGSATAVAGGGQIAARGRTTKQNEDGSVTTSSGGVYVNGNGSRAGRVSTATVNPDGSASREGGFKASGGKGTLSSSGKSSRSADGEGSGTRTTTATSSSTGNTYEGSATYSKKGGVTHTGVCKDASGAEITCPRP